MSLIEDILYHVIQCCEHDPRTLTTLLRVNKRAFSDAARVLYRDAFLVGPKSEQHFRVRSSQNMRKLEYLIALSSGYMSSVCGDNVPIQYVFHASWKNPVTLPTMTDYSKLVQYFPGGSEPPRGLSNGSLPDGFQGENYSKGLNVWKAAMSIYMPKGKPEHVTKMSKYIEFFGPRIRSLVVIAELLVNLSPSANVLSNLEAVQFDPAMVAANRAIIVNFIESHSKAFPGMLKEISLGQNLSYWSRYVDLNKVLSTPRVLSILPSEYQTHLLDEFPAASLEVIRIVTHGARRAMLNQRVYLQTCRRMIKLSTSHADEDLFGWAALERFQYHKEGEGEAKQDLIRLQEIALSGRYQAIQDAMDGFRDSLEMVDYKQDCSDGNGVIEWDWLMPRLKYLRLINVGVMGSSLRYCRHVKYLELDDPISRPKQPLWIPPLFVRELVLSGMSHERIDTSKLGLLVHLESLVCSQSSQAQSLAQRGGGGPTIKMVDTTKWQFPKLKKVQLTGSWAVQFQASFLSSAPMLETLSLTVIKRGNTVLDTSRFVCREGGYTNVRELDIVGWCADEAHLRSIVFSSQWFPRAKKVNLSDIRGLPPAWKLSLNSFF